METSSGVFTWDNLPVGILALTTMIGPTVVLYWFECRKRQERNERPPLRNKLLRPPGYSLMVKIDELWDASVSRLLWMTGLLTATGFLMLPSYRLWRAVLSGQIPWPELTGSELFPFVVVASLPYLCAPILGVAFALILRKSWTELRNYRFGLRGEQAVGEALQSAKVTEAGFRCFHDIPMDNGNIDHLAIGPPGIFVIETKTRSKRTRDGEQEDYEAQYDGKSLQFPWGTDHKAVRQAQTNAAWLGRWLQNYSAEEIRVQPVIVLPGWNVVSKGNFEVKAMSAKYLWNTYLPKEPAVYSNALLKPLIAAIDERCRTLEF